MLRGGKRLSTSVVIILKVLADTFSKTELWLLEEDNLFDNFSPSF